MSLFQFKAEPAKVTPARPPLLLFGQHIQKPRYKNLMHDEHIYRGSTLFSAKQNREKQQEENHPMRKTIQARFKENLDAEKKTSCVDIKFQRNRQSQSRFKRKGPSNIDNLFSGDEYDQRDHDQLVLTPRPRDGFQDVGMTTDEYIEVLTDKFPLQDADVQTEPLLSRCVKKEKILHFNGIDQSTQINKEDYLIDFDERTESVIRVIMNKVLEQGRMEVLEELELGQIKDQKRLSQQQKMRLLNQLQRAKAKEERIQDEKEKRIFQSKLARENKVSTHKKLLSTNYSKKMFTKIQATVETEITGLRSLLEISEAHIWTEVLPTISEKVDENIDQDQEQKMLADRMIEESLANILMFHQQNIKPKS